MVLALLGLAALLALLGLALLGLVALLALLGRATLPEPGPKSVPAHQRCVPPLLDFGGVQKRKRRRRYRRR